MPWYGKYEDEESKEEKLERRVKKLEEDAKRRNDDFSLTSRYGGGDD